MEETTIGPSNEIPALGMAFAKEKKLHSEIRNMIDHSPMIAFGSHFIDQLQAFYLE
jgi:hypothetical protein